MKTTANLYSQDADLTAKAIDGESRELATKDSVENVEHNDLIHISGPVLAEPNHEPYRRRISNPSRGLRKWIKKLMLAIKPPPSPEEIAAMSEKKRLRLLEKTLKEEARVTSRRLSRALADLGYAYVKRDPNGNITRSKYIVFDDIYSTEDAHWFHVNRDKWPYGVNSDDIIAQTVINHLSRSVGHKVNVRATPENGVWYIVERASGMMGIPVHVPIVDMWGKFPSTATGLTIPLGMTNNRKPLFDDVDDMVHILVGGQTGGGKSNFLNVLICTLITRNTPDQVQFLLFDMKAGLEFQHYENIPHLIQIPEIAPTGIIEDPDQVAPALRWLVSVEAKRRLNMIKASGHKDIKGYNARRKVKLSRLIVVIDEWSAARMGDGGKDAEHELVKALQLLRAAGIHIIVCTQVPSKEVLGIIARANLPTRIALSCSEIPASMLLVGDASAVNLGNPGRAIVKRVSGTPVQTPLISEDAVKELVAKVKGGEFKAPTPTKSHDVTNTEILEWAIRENLGSLRWQEVYSHFVHRGITAAEVQSILKELELKTVEVAGNTYLVKKGAGPKPRQLVAIDDNQEGNLFPPPPSFENAEGIQP